MTSSNLETVRLTASPRQTVQLAATNSYTSCGHCASSVPSHFAPLPLFLSGSGALLSHHLSMCSARPGRPLATCELCHICFHLCQRHAAECNTGCLANGARLVRTDPPKLGWAGGDTFLQICLWEAGHAVTSPGAGFYDWQMRSFDAGSEDRMGLVDYIMRAIEGTCHDRGVCNVSLLAQCMLNFYTLGMLLAKNV